MDTGHAKVSTRIASWCGLTATLFIVLTTIGCAFDASKPGPAAPTFADRPPLLLNVNVVEVLSRYQPPEVAPNVDHLFQPTIEESLKLWGVERLRAAGSGSTGRFVIVDASVILEKLPVSDDIIATFKKQPSERYTATVEAQLEILDSDGHRLHLASTRATRRREVLEGTPASERQRIWNDLSVQIMNDFDIEMERAIRQYLAAWVA